MNGVSLDCRFCYDFTTNRWHIVSVAYLQLALVSVALGPLGRISLALVSCILFRLFGPQLSCLGRFCFYFTNLSVAHRFGGFSLARFVLQVAISLPYLLVTGGFAINSIAGPFNGFFALVSSLVLD